jgi:predicted DNA-binding transcriptional regulator AlpA
MTHKNSFNRSGADNSTERLLPRRELRALVPVSDMTIWRWERDGLFPRHLTINSRNYWRLSELRDWIERQERAGVSPGANGHAGEI